MENLGGKLGQNVIWLSSERSQFAQEMNLLVSCESQKVWDRTKVSGKLQLMRRRKYNVAYHFLSFLFLN